MKLGLFIFITFLLCACNSGAESLVGAEESVEPSCSWWDSDKCACEEGSHLVVTKESKQCVSFKTSHFCLETKDGFQTALDQEDKMIFERCLEIPTQQASQFSKETPTVSILASSMSPHEKQRFAIWADKNTEKLRNLKSWVMPNGWRSGYIYANDKQVITSISEIFNPMVLPTTMGIDYLGISFAPMHFSNLDAMLSYLGSPEEKTAIDAKAFGGDDVVQTLISIYQQSWPQNFVMDKSNSNDGCAFACSRSSGWAYGSYDVEYRQYVIEGNVYRSEIVLKDGQKQTVGYIYLAGQKFMQMGVFVRDHMGVIVKTTIFNDHGKILNQNDASMWSSDLIGERDRIMEKTKPFDMSVAVCEWSFWPAEYEKAGLADHLHFGPNTKGSYYGWADYNGNWQTYWRERTYYNNAGLPYVMKGQGGSEHNLRVSELIVSGVSEHIGIVPIDGRDCLNGAIHNTFENAKQHGGVRVVNLSITDFQDRDVCTENFENHPLMTDADVLWVIAAGNDGTKGSLACPQYFSGRKNVLIVGASRNGYMDHQSNYGEDYVDITTLGTQMNSSVWGTSFAAPRVSQVAARLFHQYPEMSAEQVRLSIILGATVSGPQFPARSRGELHEGRAMMYARLLSDGHSVEETIQILECFGSSYKCTDGKFKMKMYEKIKQP